MDKDKPRIRRRPDVLRKVNAESILAIERGLLGDLPDRLKPRPPEPVRERPNDLQLVSKPSGLLSSCLPVVIESPVSAPLTPSEPLDDEISPLKKSFSFRDKFSRISFFGSKEKQDKPKWKTIEEERKKSDEFKEIEKPRMEKSKTEHQDKSSKRFWFFRNKELVENRKHTPIYKRSKSFEFLPRALDEEDEECFKKPREITKNQSYVFGSTDTMGDAWTSNESLEYISNVYYENDDTVFLKSIKEFPSELSSANNSSISTATSESSGLVVNIFKRESVQDLLEEFDKAVDMFSENYLSDCEPYTKPKKELTLREKRRSSSFDTFRIQSPKIVPVSKVSELSEDFKRELSKALVMKRESVGRSPTARRGSVTDWFVLEDQHAKHQHETNKYRRAQKKPVNRVRRISSTKYLVENTYKNFYYPENKDEPSDDEGTLGFKIKNAIAKRGNSIDGFFEKPKKRKLTKKSSSVSRATSHGVACLTTNEDDGQYASHLIKIEVYDVNKIKNIAPTEMWKHADVRLKYYSHTEEDKNLDAARDIIFNITKKIASKSESVNYVIDNDKKVH